jgi:chromatin segregation and condensation protein Rec8/ScpA/Scc1 (kleisin family)
MTILNNNLENTIYENSPAFDKNDGIGILVDMAKSGKIDPWNIDIVDVTEKYLQKMIEMKSLNLRVASRTLLFAAILCRMQSNPLSLKVYLAIVWEENKSVAVFLHFPQAPTLSG